MAPNKEDFRTMLKNKPAKTLRQGTGVQLSTETQPAQPTGEGATSVDSESAHVHIRTNATGQPRTDTVEVKRTSQGQRLRVDLVRELKRIAFEDQRKLYQVMEEAIEQYLDRRAASQEQGLKAPRSPEDAQSGSVG